MMPINWFDTEYILVCVLALLLILGASTFSIFRKKRLRIFYNPTLTGDGTRWYKTGTMILFLALGVSSVAAIIPASARKTPHRDDSEQVIEVLLDSESFSETEVAPQDLSNWLGDSIQWIIENGPTEKISIWQTGASAELLVPSTWDVQSIQLLMAAFFAKHPDSKTQDILDCVTRMSLALSGTRNRIVVLSARTEQEIENWVRSVTSFERGIIFVRTSINSTSEPNFYHQDAAGKWMWESAKSRFRDELQNEQPSRNRSNTWLPQMSVIQTLALLAFIFLSAESAWHLLINRN